MKNQKVKLILMTIFKMTKRWQMKKKLMKMKIIVIIMNIKREREHDRKVKNSLFQRKKKTSIIQYKIRNMKMKINTIMNWIRM